MKSDTPRSNFEESQQTQRLGVRSSFARQLERELNTAIRECKILQQWKDEMIIVNKRWGAVDAYVRKHPDVLVGQDISTATLRLLDERDTARKAAKDLAKTVLLHVREHEDEHGVRLAREWSKEPVKTTHENRPHHQNSAQIQSSV